MFPNRGGGGGRGISRRSGNDSCWNDVPFYYFLQGHDNRGEDNINAKNRVIFIYIVHFNLNVYDYAA